MVRYTSQIQNLNYMLHIVCVNPYYLTTEFELLRVILTSVPFLMSNSAETHLSVWPLTRRICNRKAQLALFIGHVAPSLTYTNTNRAPTYPRFPPAESLSETL